MNRRVVSMQTNQNTREGYGQLLNMELYIAKSAEMDTPENPKIIKDTPLPLIAALAHEVRNPLTCINICTEMLKSKISNKNKVIYIDIIKRNTSKINNLIYDLITFREADQSRTEKHSLHEVINEVIEIAKDRLMLKNIKLSRNFAPRDYQVLINKPKIKIALTNIIINAIDAMSSNNGELTLVTKSKGDKYILQIEDNGCGISKSNLQNIFKTSFSGSPGGLGIGLAATLNILKSGHVKIKVTSSEGIGTRFVLSFEKYKATLL
jgi:signal transduction histidine kinase